jgi:hypothetical protein
MTQMTGGLTLALAVSKCPKGAARMAVHDVDVLIAAAGAAHRAASWLPGADIMARQRTRQRW